MLICICPFYLPTFLVAYLFGLIFWFWFTYLAYCGQCTVSSSALMILRLLFHSTNFAHAPFSQLTICFPWLRIIHTVPYSLAVSFSPLSRCCCTPALSTRFARPASAAVYYVTVYRLLQWLSWECPETTFLLPYCNSLFISFLIPLCPAHFPCMVR